MNVLMVILQVASGSTGTQWSGIVVMIVIVAIFYFIKLVIKRGEKRDDFK